MSAAEAHSPLSAEATAFPTRYGRVSMALHWIMAALILTQLGLGWYMNEVLPDHSPAQHRIEDLHISVGFTFLLLVLVRIAVRLTHPAPRLPNGLTPWERGLARATHLLFYAVMLALPLAGWAMISTRHAPIAMWGIGLPRLPGLAPSAPGHPNVIGRTLKHVHVFWLVWVLVLNLALHVAGALKHQFDGSPVLWRMIPFLRAPQSSSRPASAA